MDFVEAFEVDVQGTMLGIDIHMMAGKLDTKLWRKHCFKTTFSLCCGHYGDGSQLPGFWYTKFAGKYDEDKFHCCGPRKTYVEDLCFDDQGNVTFSSTAR